LIQFDNWTGLGGSTQRLHHKHIGSISLYAPIGLNDVFLMGAN